MPFHPPQHSPTLHTSGFTPYSRTPSSCRIPKTHTMIGDDKAIEIASDCEVVDEQPADTILLDASSVESATDSDDDMDVQPVAPAAAKTVASSAYPVATDHKMLAQRLMKPLPDYPAKDEAHFTWAIGDWSAARSEEKLRSPRFSCGGFEWNMLLFPKGNSDSLSLYMEPHPPTPPGGSSMTSDAAKRWYVCAQFALDIWNPNHPESHFPSSSSHRFTPNETDWGFSSFIAARDLASPAKCGQKHAILENNQLNITGYVRVIDDSATGVLWHNFLDYDSKSHTGYVGLNNQGATCYLNSLIQSYYTTRVFRDLVCQIPTADDSGSKAVALALQRIFYLLQLSHEPVGTMELTKSFGWDSNDAFTQHDVQELNRVLMDRLELAMKGSRVEKKLNDVFVGKMRSYIKCVDVPYESSRVEDFWDIQLNVKGFRTLQQSFENYIEIEMLDGENKYQAGEQYGYQDAKKGVVFELFPPVLHLQLKRFEYDFMVDDLVKIDDLYEFPDSIDLSPYLDADLPLSVRSENWTYKLHGVLVHQGSISNGHYYAMIKPEATSDTWLRFDDDKVWKVTPTQVFQENFGATDLSPAQVRLLSRLERNEFMIRRATSAYMLVYYRESELDVVLPTELAPIPSHVSEQIIREKEELANWERKKREALLYVNVKIATVDNFAYYNGFDTYPDPAKPKFFDPSIFDSRAYPQTLSVKKEAKFSSLYKLVAKKLGYLEDDSEIEEVKKLGDAEASAIDVDADDYDDEDISKYPFRLVAMKHRNNRTSRPDYPIPLDLNSATVNDVYIKCFKRKYDELVFFVEEYRKELTKINYPVTRIAPEIFNFDTCSSRITDNQIELGSHFDEDNIKIFIKYFDPVSNEVRGVTYASVSKDTIVSSLSEPINLVLGFDILTPLEYFEEVSLVRIERIDESVTLDKNELSNGDILTVQIANIETAAQDGNFSNAIEYYEFLLTRFHILVKPCKAGDDEEDSNFVADEQTPETETANGESAEAHEIQLAKEMSRSFEMWVSTSYTYQELAHRIATRLGNNVDPEHLRLFVINSNGARLPLSSTLVLSQIFTKQVAVSSTIQFEYEVLNITLKEYENMKSVKIYWLNTILQFHLLDLLVPKTSTVADLIKKVIDKMDVPKEHWSNLLVWAGQESKYADLVKFDRSIEDLNNDYEYYCGYFPAEVEVLAGHDMLRRFDENYTSASDIADEALRLEFELAQRNLKLLNIVPVFHFQKSTSYVHSKPFVFVVYPEESFEDTKTRLRKKLGLGIQAFEKIKIALADINDKGRYLDAEKADLNLLNEILKFDSHVSLALDHPDRNPRRANPYERGISIR